jgi:spore cortex formation protein SpoVR/YcgB (stage V sporulation)
MSYRSKRPAVDPSMFRSEKGQEDIRDEIAEEMHCDCDPKVSLIDVDTRKNCAGQHRNDNSRLALAVM